jgi:hypothetical protein
MESLFACSVMSACDRAINRDKVAHQIHERILLVSFPSKAILSIADVGQRTGVFDGILSERIVSDAKPLNVALKDDP